ncbi:GNAT family N-acetyltransferase [Streptomyces aureocirculatus]|uniref:GNAT family N-acetyltransferase n=1 Tax=Streptomyces aureocirculatus TaxID=67275 RepID=UPI00068F6650|nr:GNAT family N-acetyltransferase [Streptomyces aureocirculatus]
MDDLDHAGGRACEPADADIRIRAAGPADVPAFLGILDSAVGWLVSQGRTGQWGTRPLSESPRTVELVEKYAAVGSPWVAEVGGAPAGMLLLTDEPSSYVPAVGEPERYVHFLAADPRFAGRGVGRALLARAAAETRAAGVSLLRVDCYAGGDGKLVAYYESNGFTRALAFTEKDGTWPGQVLERRV